MYYLNLMAQSIHSHKQYQERTFQRLELSQVSLVHCEFIECVFRDCLFSEVTFSNCRLIRCRFEGCDFSLAQFPGAILASAHFGTSKLIGVDWTLADWSSPRIGDGLIFEGCNLNYSTFIGLSLPGLRIVNCSAKNVDFRDADLTGADFNGTDLSESLFLNTNLSGADLSQAQNYTIPPLKNVLKSARFSLPEALSLLYSLEIEIAGPED